MNMERQLTNFGKAVKIRLIEKNMTQVELAGLVGTSKIYLNRIIFGERSGDKYVLKIAKILDIDILEKTA